MKSIVSILVCFIIYIPSLHAQNSLPADVDSVRLKSGVWLETNVVSFNERVLYVSDGSPIMLRVASEITTAQETLATALASLLPGSVVSGSGSRWSLRLDNASIPIGETRDDRFFSGASLSLNLATTRVGNIEMLLHFDPAMARWLVVELDGSCGWSSSDGVRDIAGGPGIFQSGIDYEAFQLCLGLGVQHSLWTGRVEAVASVGKRLLNSSATTPAGSTIHLANALEDVSFVTLRYVHLLQNTSFLLSLAGRYYVSNTVIDGVEERFGISVGVGLMLY